MATIGIGLAVFFCLLTPADFFGQSDQELLEYLGKLTFVDYDQEQITVQSADGNEAVFEVSNETEIFYVDPETEEEEPMELKDLEPGFMMLIRYEIGKEESYLARTIEIRSLGLGKESDVSS
jgi:hypothetical protein